MDLTSLPEGLEELALVDADGYQEELPPAPPKPGNYRLEIVECDLAKDDADNLRLDQGKYPQLVLAKVRIVEPIERDLFLFQRISSRPLKNRGGASRMADLVRAHDRDATWSDGRELFSRLNELVSEGKSFWAFLDWEAKDSGWLQNEAAKLGGFDKIPVEEWERLGAWKCVGQKNFPVDDRGRHMPVWKGPSQDQFEARATIRKFYPSDAVVNPVKL